MKKTLLVSLCALLLTNISFAQVSNYTSPFGGTYTGDFQKYRPQNQKEEKKQKNKVEISRIVLLNDDKTLRNNVNLEDMVNYVKSLEKTTITTLNNLTESNEIVLEASVGKNDHKVLIALKNELNQKDNQTVGKLENLINKIPPFATNDTIKMHIYFNIDKSLPIMNKHIIKTN